jgi:hypothetical protein
MSANTLSILIRTSESSNFSSTFFTLIHGETSASFLRTSIPFEMALLAALFTSSALTMVDQPAVVQK